VLDTAQAFTVTFGGAITAFEQRRT